MHQVLRERLYLSSRSILGRLGASESLWQGKKFPWLPYLSPVHSHLNSQFLLHPGRGQGDPGLRDSKQTLVPDYCPIILPRAQQSRAVGLGGEIERRG